MAALARPARAPVSKPEPKTAPAETKEAPAAKAEPPAAAVDTALSQALAIAAAVESKVLAATASAEQAVPAAPAAPTATATAAVDAPAIATPAPASATVVAAETLAARPAARPAGTPAIGAADAFIPPPPTETTSGRGAMKADPFAVADMANRPRETPAPAAKAKEAAPAPATPAAVKARAPSLFERVVGISRAREAVSERAKASAAETGNAPVPHPAVLRATPEERVPASQTEDDLLDIPAFLRRQAN